MTSFRSGICASALAMGLCASAAAWAQAAAPAVVKEATGEEAGGITVPVKKDEGPTTIGPLPVVDAQDDQKASPKDSLGAPESEEEPQSMAGTMFRMLLVLGIVVALIYVTLNFGLRKLMGIKGMPGGRSGLVQVVERIPLDPKRSLFVIKAAGEYLLVGGADDNLSLISRMDPDVVKGHLDQQRRNAAQPSPFLQKLLQKDPPAQKKPDDPPPAEKV